MEGERDLRAAAGELTAKASGPTPVQQVLSDAEAATDALEKALGALAERCLPLRASGTLLPQLHGDHEGREDVLRTVPAQVAPLVARTGTLTARIQGLCEFVTKLEGELAV